MSGADRPFHAEIKRRSTAAILAAPFEPLVRLAVCLVCTYVTVRAPIWAPRLASQLEGGAGADEINGGADVDRVVYSDSGAQTITLDDVRNDGVAGELDNVHADIEDVAAGPGNDRLDGGGGVDTFLGGDGADTLLARDGARERVDCGPENDGGQADTIDELVACEAVGLGDELVPDVDGDGATKPGDCDDHNPAIRPASWGPPFQRSG